MFAIKLVKRAYSMLPFPFNRRRTMLDHRIAKKLEAILSPDCSVDDYLERFKDFVFFSAIRNNTTVTHEIAKFKVSEVYRLQDLSCRSQHQSLCVRFGYEGEERFIVFERLRSNTTQDPWKALLCQKAQANQSAQAILDEYTRLSQKSVRQDPASDYQDCPHSVSMAGSAFLGSSSFSSVDSLGEITEPVKAKTHQTHPDDNVQMVDKLAVDQLMAGPPLKTSSLSLYYVILAAAVIGAEDTMYLPLKHQCCWYSNLLYFVLERCFQLPSTSSLGPTDGDQSDTASIKDPDAETWWQIPIADIRESLLGYMHEEFAKAVLEDEKLFEEMCKAVASYRGKGLGSRRIEERV